jgi:hypothetical protein
MPVLVDDKEFALRKSEFIWGFDNGHTQSIRPALFPVENMLARKGTELVREIARCGWDIPEIEVELRTAESRSGRLFTFISSVTVPYSGSLQKIAFDVSLNAAADGVSTNFVDYFHEVGSEETLYGDKLAANSDEVTLFSKIVDHTIEKLSTRPSADGFQDYAPNGDANLRTLLDVIPIPAPRICPTFYARVAAHQLERTSQDGSNRLFGPRLLPLSSSINKEGLHPRVFDGFIYATANPDKTPSNGIHTPSGEELVVEIKLSDLNEVYVVDGARRLETEMAYQELMEKTGRDYLDPEEAEEIFTAIARTMVPMTEYRGGFQAPTYLIGRCLLRGEARLVKGPTEVLRSDDGIDVKLIDNKSGRKITLHQYQDATASSMERAVSLAQRVAAELSTEALVPKSVLSEIDTDRRKRYANFVESQLKSGERDELLDLLMKPSAR